MPTYVYRFLDSGRDHRGPAVLHRARAHRGRPPDRRRRRARCARSSRPVGITFKGNGFYKTDSRGRARPRRRASRRARRQERRRSPTAARRARPARRARRRQRLEHVEHRELVRDRSARQLGRGSTGHTHSHGGHSHTPLTWLDDRSRRAEIGVFGGSGFYAASSTTHRGRRGRDALRRAVGAVTIGTVAGRRVAFLPRHGPRTTSSRPTPSPTGPTSGPCASSACGCLLAPCAVGSLAARRPPR